jgi:hypothetical protein
VRILFARCRASLFLDRGSSPQYLLFFPERDYSRYNRQTHFPVAGAGLGAGPLLTGRYLMPIQFACPACGKQTTVADQYAGQSGPCAGCGKQITIPFAAGPVAYPGYKGPSGAGVAAGAGAGILVVLLVVGAVVLVCGGVLVALLLPAVQQAREAARRMQSTNNMKQILIAMHTYHDTYKEFPPAVVKDASGKPLYSGMVCLLPFLEQQPLYDRFQKDKAWDSPENLTLSGITLPMLTDPSNPDATAGRTDYLLISGPGSVLEDTPGMKHGLQNITDGTSNTIVLMEVKGKGSWAAPNTWDLGKPLDGSHPQVVIVGFADGSVRTIRRDINPQTLRLMVEQNDGQALPPER